MSAVRFRVVIDDDALQPDDPPEIAAGLASGAFTAYGVIREQMCDMGGWHGTNSLWSVVVESDDAVGTYGTPAEIPDAYLSSVATDLASEGEQS